VRQRILELIQERGQVTVADLADALGMAPVSVRHHLDILQGDGLIRVDGVRRRTGAGRPQHTYSLTPEAVTMFPKNYKSLLHHLLDDLKCSFPRETLDHMIERIAERMAQEIQWDGAPTADVEARLDRIVAFLSERGYLARWERRQDGTYVITTANCPYADLAPEHRELCRLDALLVQHLTREPITQEGVIRNGAHPCAYVLRVPVVMA